ncbi:hypothetical protein PIROE2DRAFT_66786 [Piromyces sp. E2]|nr:hypothetical protein PIROE2DRAFT_66786 [Piromyces sp. E2]|eukprot:OUM69708.1 hypothetical protein PIROE2DRAFT_66786 [Piromyces sp. E2]
MEDKWNNDEFWGYYIYKYITGMIQSIYIIYKYYTSIFTSIFTCIYKYIYKYILHVYYKYIYMYITSILQGH